MRAPFVLITALLGVALLTGGCQSDTGQRGTRAPGTSLPNRSDSGTAGTSGTYETSGVAESSTVRRVFDHKAMATSVRRVLSDDYDIADVGEVTCPAGENVTEGNTFRCTTSIDGDEQQVEITVRGDDGEYVVSHPE